MIAASGVLCTFAGVWLVALGGGGAGGSPGFCAGLAAGELAVLVDVDLDVVVAAACW